MRVTKHEHACLVVEKSGQRLVIDPGSFTTALIDVDGVVAIVVTHEHADHWTSEQLRHLLDRNPEAQLFGPPGVVRAASEFSFTEVNDGDVRSVGDFTLNFYGTTHAVIHSSIPVIDNVGVMVDNTLFYPGDAFTVPPVPVETLAVPAAAPWLKISEAMDYLATIAPKRSFPTHQMVLSRIGQDLVNGHLAKVAELGGGEYFTLEPDESLDL